ncbi:uncharacterized protein BCR38DRAFT_109855 [Pseudomassariella vexata]|uniref:F-box domain-containing protein n=1 Tax=Pseudomassariella vexata TaxID=1141098 RepID=A0A1Y2DD80_9PEZI|nr:uncharacterized protein BCR38DRAFT_109855 [Pseudomassariella vexata]ORY57231.1 hypothetical protein BCR38DRAFT_109855 [Pseudomassariella vexata]
MAVAVPTIQPICHGGTSATSRGRQLMQKPHPSVTHSQAFQQAVQARIRQQLGPNTWNPGVASLGGIARNPRHQYIIDQICRYTDYQTLIHIRRANKALRNAINPQLAPYESKRAFVLRACKDFPQNYKDTIRWACYSCFLCRETDKFAANQARQAIRGLPPNQELVNLPNFCIDCGVRHGLHRPGEKMTPITGKPKWLCGCPLRPGRPVDDILHILGKDTRCDYCDTNAPLSGGGARDFN